jgi:hypothetical protein
MLPSSIEKLCKSFKIDKPKGNFPFLLNDIFYNGLFPALKYWIGISPDDYLALSLNFGGKPWNFKDESIKYCNLDCKCLYEILTLFNKLVYKQFKVNIHNSLTLPALAMRIYKTNFMPDDMVYQLPAHC